MKQRILALLLAGLTALCLTACGSADPHPQEETDPAADAAGTVAPIPAGSPPGR